MSADTSSTFGNRKKMKKKKLRHSSMGGCVRFELYSVVERLQVGVKANERNVVKPVIVCRSKEEQKGDANGCAVMYLDVTCFGHERVWRQFEFCRTRTEVGNCFCCFEFESLIVESVCDTSYFSQVAFVALQLPSKVA